MVWVSALPLALEASVYLASTKDAGWPSFTLPLGQGRGDLQTATFAPSGGGRLACPECFDRGEAAAFLT